MSKPPHEARNWTVPSRVPLPSWIFGFLALAGYRLVASFPTSRNADDANNLLAGVDMVGGNWLLHGWTLAPDNYLPTDVLAQGLASLLLGSRPVLIEAVEAAIWAMVALVAVSLTIGEATGWSRRFAGLTIATLITVVEPYAEPMYGFLTGVGSHGSTILLTLLSFQGASQLHGRASPAALWRLGVLVLVGSFADPIYITICVLPLLAICALQIRRRDRTRPFVATVGAILIAFLLSRTLLRLLPHLGGFHSTPLSLQFASFDETLGHLGFAAHGIVALLGADFFGRGLTGHLVDGPLLPLGRFPFVLAFGLVITLVGLELVRALRDWPRSPTAEPTSSDILDHMLGACVLTCIASSVVTRVIVDETCVRFFLPATVAGSILMVRRLLAVPAFALYAAAASTMSIAVGLLGLMHGPARPVIALPSSWRLAQTLRQHDLHHGYGGYWQSSLTTVLTRSDIQTLALIDDRGHAARPFDWFANMAWYKNAADHWHDRVFFITAQHPVSPIELSQETVLHMFGQPMETIPIDGGLIDIYQMGDRGLDRLAP
jgi:hypothetical protein